MTEAAQKIQALLFVAGEAVTKEELQRIAGVSDEELVQCQNELTEALQDTGLTLVQTETTLELTTSPSVADFLAQFQQEKPDKLSKAAAEVLSIIAYRSPISRYDVDIIRGVDSSRSIRQLMRRGVVRKLQRAGTTPLYEITEEFLTNMGVTKKEELPNFETLSNDEAISRALNIEDNK